MNGFSADSTCRRPMSYAVRDFYLNGGTQALIVRVAHADARAAVILLSGDGSPAGDIVLVASSVGAWGNRLSAAVDHDTDRALPRASPPATNPQRFNLTVRYRVQTGRDNFVTENFGSVSTVEGDPRYLPLVLERESGYVRVQGPVPADRPHSNVTGSGAQRVVNWVDAGTGIRRQRDRRQRRDRRAGSEDRHLCAEPRRSVQPSVHPAIGARHVRAAVELGRHFACDLSGRIGPVRRTARNADRRFGSGAGPYQSIRRFRTRSMAATI